MHSLMCALSSMIPVLWVAFLLSVSADFSTDQMAPPQHNCNMVNTSRGIKVYCNKRHLKSVPQDLPNRTIALDLSRNLISQLQNNSFVHLWNLITLNLQKNVINYIENAAFTPLIHLEILCLSKNRLTKLHPGLLNSNRNLTRVDLGNNLFKAAPITAMNDLARLETLILMKNFIQSLDFQSAIHWKKITNIDLSLNNITSIPHHAFFPLQNNSIGSLDFTRNKITEVLPEVFSDLTSVDWITLNGNQINKFEVLAFMGNLKIKKLSIYGTFLQEIIPLNMSTCERVPIPHILNIDLGSNWISDIPQNAFCGFYHTLSLSIQLNKITNIANASFCGLHSLQILDISENHISALSLGAFSCNENLLHLNISHNKIVTLHPNSFLQLSMIQHFNLSCKDRPWTIKTLLTLDLAFNNLGKLSHNVLGGVPNIKVLDVSHNGITVYSPVAFAQTPHLQELYLNSQGHSYLAEVFREMTDLQILDLSYTKLNMNSTYQFTGATSLRKLRLRFNNLESESLFDNKTNHSLFAGQAMLERLYLKGNSLNRMEIGTFSSLKNLKTLDISDSKINVLKPGLFQNLSSLTTLYLSGNQIQEPSVHALYGLHSLGSLFFEKSSVRSLPLTLFNDTPHLFNLFLSENQLTTIALSTIFPTPMHLDLSHNPLSCMCDLAWFRNWVELSSVVLMQPNKTICSRSSFETLVNHPFLLFDPEEFCSLNVTLIVSVSLVLIMVGYVAIVVYYKRWWFRYRLYLLKLAILGYEEVEDNQQIEDYRHQLNVMFSDGDEDWVNNVMRPAMEERFPQFESILWGDDYLHIGMYLVDAIHHALENSYKTVLVISNQSVEEPWFMTKLRMALEHINETKLDKVVLIFKEDVEDDQLPYLVRLFLSANRPYLKWEEDEYGQDLFWAKLEKNFRSNRVINNAIPA
ncbi:toll-like receptor 8 [Diadema setosum]|uniref:toll-like receptor 8 n=1 Tax=Diadema setosum TaxID=31175 RepID=UPI003B3A0DBC